MLEIWVKSDSNEFKLFKDYEICNFSGDLGPKLKEGDRQSPEGFYSVGAKALNPNNSFHLSFNLGFPNAYDQSHQRTGSYLMVHGDCVSVGCYAMTDGAIEEIYLLVEAALQSGQPSVPVHAFPFRMTSERLSAETENQWFDFLMNLKTGYDMFQITGVPPSVTVLDQAYISDDKDQIDHQRIFLTPSCPRWRLKCGLFCRWQTCDFTEREAPCQSVDWLGVKKQLVQHSVAWT